MLRSRSPCGERGLKLRPDGQSHQEVRRSPCGERGLKSSEVSAPGEHRRRSPCGERGLKSRAACTGRTSRTSLPVRGAWVEIANAGKVAVLEGRSPCGERGLKFLFRALRRVHIGRSPCGERGLKSPSCGVGACGSRSLPVRGAWVEIERCAMALRYSAVAPRAGSVG